jgi:hypothetical protein
MNQAAEAFPNVSPGQPQGSQTDIADMLRACFQKQREAYFASRTCWR